MRADTLELATECAIPATALKVVVATASGRTTGLRRRSEAGAGDPPAPARGFIGDAHAGGDRSPRHADVHADRRRAEGRPQVDGRGRASATAEGALGQPLTRATPSRRRRRARPRPARRPRAVTPPRPAGAAATDPVDLTARITSSQPGGALPATPQGPAPGARGRQGHDGGRRDHRRRDTVTARGGDPLGPRGSGGSRHRRQARRVRQGRGTASSASTPMLAVKS